MATLLAMAVTPLLAVAVGSADGTADRRYHLVAAATLTRLAPAPTGERYTLRAELADDGAQVPAPAAGGRFALSVAPAATSLVCYNDTIFRDDLDGDGF